MSGAPYQFDAPLSDDSSFIFTFELVRQDGSDFPWSDGTFEYVIKAGDGCGGGGFTLTSPSDGIMIDTELNALTITKAGAHGLYPGRYVHALRRTDAEGRKTILFDGSITVFRDPFA